MAQNVINTGIKDIVGCIDPSALNFNPFATTACGPIAGQQPQPDLGGIYTNGCCEYSIQAVTGCMDSNANNYDPTAVVACTNCCDYGTGGSGGIGQEAETIKPDVDPVFNPGSGDGALDPIIGTNPQTGDGDVIDCSQLFPEVVNGVVVSGGQPIPEKCCVPNVVPFETTWDVDSEQCLVIPPNNNLCDNFSLGLITAEEFNNRVVCINCDNFAWWDNLYTTINGASLQDTNQDLWNFLVEIITSDPNDPLSPNFGDGSFYVDNITGEPILGEDCCNNLDNSNFTTTINEFGEEVSACICDRTPQTTERCVCITTINDFNSLVSTKEGAALILNVQVLSSLGLTLSEANFVINNFFSQEDSDNNGVPDSTDASILISNALYLKGGFYICFQQTGTIENQTGLTLPPKPQNSLNSLPIGVSEIKCTELGGYWDGTLCYCDPQEECEISLTDITVVNQPDGFNQQVSLVTANGEPISETCCLKIAKENNLPWVYKLFDGVPNCYTKDPSPCLPLEFRLNQKPIVPECDLPLDVSVSFYFATPENPCFEIEDDGEVIIVDGETDPCLLEFDEDNNLVDYNTVQTPRRLELPKPGVPDITPDTTTPDDTNNGDVIDNTISDEPCCFNPNIPIVANLVIKDTDNNILQTSDNISFSTLETWYDVTTQFVTTGATEVNISLQFISGLNCCCTYDIFLDNFKFNCSDEETIVDVIRNNCPGFDIAPVIDNKKSWVYNPGLINYSNYQNQSGTFTDNTIIGNGDNGLIQGYGVVNRTFAPSPDADLPWRYTDYFKQSSVLEKHSNLVLNSKELYLTFDMCNIGGPCPDGYTLSAGTETCYRTTIGCPDGFTLSGGTCVSGNTCDCLNIEWTLTGGTTGATLNTHYVGFQDGKRVWLFDVSGDTHSIEYRNATNSWLIFENIFGSQIAYQFSSTTECPTSTLVDWTYVAATSPLVFSELTITEGTCTGTTASTINVTQTQKSDPLACKTKLTLLELEKYKKTFQSFWVQFVEQFVPATTIFISGERWCNRPDEICTQYEECDFDFEFVEGDVTTIPNIGGVVPPRETNDGSNNVPIERPGYDGELGDDFGPSDYRSTEDGPIDTPGVKINPLPKERGETITEPSVVNDVKNRIDRMAKYRERLQPTETIIE